ncbi:MAG: 6,7-dimethyl-8-ribityllumazine synthase [Gammaproteobacteria bacterium]|nr:6,7-dimethyl-8-ribityllumazine synthase [Gammaproteobacteria bacterium]MCH9743442.1 6,7-dimethyl-8-ribityllumazine synthase [Gammaproteobacteria bacterium]
MSSAIRLAIIVSRFNEPITSKLLEGALKQCQKLKIPEQQVKVCEVPGAVEIPLIAQRLACQGHYDAIICLGAVIRGETTHYDYVCQQVSQGCQKVSLEQDLPVIFGILTTENADQAYDRVGGAKGHKGEEAVDAALEMVELLHSL